MNNQMLTIPEVARQLRVSPALIYRAVRSGELTAIRAGVRRVVIEPAALEAFLANRRTRAHHEAGS